MLSNNFWYGFLMGAGLVFGIYFVAKLLIGARAKNASSMTTKQPVTIFSTFSAN
jgi:hypothetical protein